jgi:hypothetical protein
VTIETEKFWIKHVKTNKTNKSRIEVIMMTKEHRERWMSEYLGKRTIATEITTYFDREETSSPQPKGNPPPKRKRIWDGAPRGPTAGRCGL